MLHETAQDNAKNRETKKVVRKIRDNGTHRSTTQVLLCLLEGGEKHAGPNSLPTIHTAPTDHVGAPCQRNRYQPSSVVPPFYLSIHHSPCLSFYVSHSEDKHCTQQSENLHRVPHHRATTVLCGGQFSQSTATVQTLGRSAWLASFNVFQGYGASISSVEVSFPAAMVGGMVASSAS